MSGEKAVLRLHDPVSCYTYTILRDGLASQLRPGVCGVEVVPFKPDAAADELHTQLSALSREETPEQDNVVRFFSDEVRLTRR
jgi:hypothetical protein